MGWRARIPPGRLSHEGGFQREDLVPLTRFQKQRDDTPLFRCTKEKKFVPVHTYSETEVFHANKTAFHHRCLQGIGGSPP